MTPTKGTAMAMAAGSSAAAYATPAPALVSEGQDARVSLIGAAASGVDMTSAAAVAAKAIVRYADPLSWAVVAAVNAASRAEPGLLARCAENTALLHVTPGGPSESMKRVRQDAATAFVSPTRFLAAAPSSPAGLACLAFGLRGPSLCLPMPLENGTSVALQLAARWLARRTVEVCAVVISGPQRDGMPIAACALLAPDTGDDGTSMPVVKVSQMLFLLTGWPSRDLA